MGDGYVIENVMKIVLKIIDVVSENENVGYSFHGVHIHNTNRSETSKLWCGSYTRSGQYFIANQSTFAD